jgi:hypothetical protein
MVNLPRIIAQVGVRPESFRGDAGWGAGLVTHVIMTNCSTRVEFNNYKASYLLL